MAIGDKAIEAGYAIVPDSGVDGRVRYGAREINRTRDYIATVKQKLDEKPDTRAEYREATGIYYGPSTPSPSLGTIGDLYFRHG